MSQLSSPETDGDLDPVAQFQELDRPMDLRLKVARADLRREADLLERHRALPALVFLLFLRQLVLVLPEVKEPCDRRLCHRGDFNEIEPPFLRHLESACSWHDAQLCAFFIHDPNLWDPDHLIDSQVSTDGSPLFTDFRFDPTGHTKTRPSAEPVG